MNTHHGDTEARSSSGLLSEPLTETIIGAAIEVHRQPGPGALESVYEECMCEELSLRSVPFKCQIELPIVYKGRETGGKYRIDLVVADEVVVELKAVERSVLLAEAECVRNRRSSWSI
jgi:GxxExxY protein